MPSDVDCTLYVAARRLGLSDNAARACVRARALALACGMTDAPLLDATVIYLLAPVDRRRDIIDELAAATGASCAMLLAGVRLLVETLAAARRDVDCS